MELMAGLLSRRSLRRFAPGAVPMELLREAVAAACGAPAPHHTRPWRFVAIMTAEAKERLATAMGERWRQDLEADAVPGDQIHALLARSRQRLSEAPALVLACLVDEGLRHWPDQRRQTAEWQMAVQSTGAALQNLMLAAHALGLASYWISAPLFCPETIQEVLGLPAAFHPQALIALGRPAPDAQPGQRPPLDLGNVLLEC